jgi:hypothetical protein
LIELLLAVAIGAIILSLAVPSFVGEMKRQKLEKTFTDFDDFVQKVHIRSVTEHIDLLMEWDDSGISVWAENTEEGGFAAQPEKYPAPKGAITIERPAAFGKNPPPEWAFWHSGICEPAIITYKGSEGSWKVKYDALTGRGTTLEKSLP